MDAYRNSSRTTYVHSRQSYDAETVDTNHTNLDDDDDDDVDSTNYTYLDRNRNPRDSQSRSKKHTSTSSSPSDNDNNNPSGELLTSCTGTINTRSTRIYDNITCPPSLVEQIRQSQQSQNGPTEGPGGTAGGCASSDSISSINVVLPETTTNCIANNFDIVNHSENIQNYKSIAYNFANPCSTIINEYLTGAEELGRKSEYVMHKEQQQHNDHHRQHQQQHHQQQPMTPSTVGSSYSDENDDDDDDENQNNNNNNNNCDSNEEEEEPNIKSNDENRPTSMNRSGPSISTDDDDDVRFHSCFSTGTGSDNNNNISNDSSNGSGNNVPTLILVGDQEYICPSARGSLTSRYFITQRQKISPSVGSETTTTTTTTPTTYDDHGNSHMCKFYVDLSTHSSQEFMLVKTFLEKWDNDDDDDYMRINWNNVHVILPWFVEFQAMPLMSAIDIFLFHNALGGWNNDGDGVVDSDGNNNIISLSNLLLLTQIAYICGLETTKLNARKLLRRRLLEPRKQNIEVNDSQGEGGEEEEEEEVGEGVGENIELEWTLDDLQTLAQMLQSFDDLRVHLWEYAIIVYLPHDLDISDSVELVSNILFPYLLREGMMQMMIVEGIESSFPTSESSFVNNNKTQSTIESLSFSTAELSTTCSSDTTIPTNPSLSFPERKISTEEIHHHLLNTIEQLEKFQIEKNMRRTASRSSRNDHCPAALVVVDDEESLLIRKETNTGRKNRRQKRYNNRATSTPGSSAANLTFSC
jgi:hypothetical protein